VTVLFYFKFNETVSPSKLFGFVLLIICVTLLLLESSKEAPAEESQLDQAPAMDDMESEAMLTRFQYGVLAILSAFIAPILWTTKIYYIRFAESSYQFPIFKATMDALFLQGLIQCCVLTYYCLWVGVYDSSLMLYGTITGVCFVFAAQILSLAFFSGPGGPV
jgi:hypothetical protein